jgi:hypothetical protein
MPPDGYTTVTISTETATKLSTVMIEHEVDSMARAIDYAADLAIEQEKLTNAELARLLHHRLDDQEGE